MLSLSGKSLFVGINLIIQHKQKTTINSICLSLQWSKQRIINAILGIYLKENQGLKGLIAHFIDTI